VATSVREPRADKVAVVDEVRVRIDESSAAILTEYRGLSVKAMEELRRALTAAGGDYKVYKNTLVRRAARESGLDEFEAMLVGPTAIAFVRDDVASVAKVLRDFARTNPQLVVKGGIIGRSAIDARSAAALADLPSREALLAQIAGLLAAPMQRFAGLLQAVPQKFAYALSALVESKGGAPATVEEPTAPVADEPAASAPAEEPDAAAEAAEVEAPTADAPVADALVAEAEVAEAEAPAEEAAAEAEESTSEDEPA
jgi:large subunit ribosomal protein L10